MEINPQQPVSLKQIQSDLLSPADAHEIEEILSADPQLAMQLALGVYQQITFNEDIFQLIEEWMPGLASGFKNAFGKVFVSEDSLVETRSVDLISLIRTNPKLHNLINRIIHSEIFLYGSTALLIGTLLLAIVFIIGMHNAEMAPYISGPVYSQFDLINKTNP